MLRFTFAILFSFLYIFVFAQSNIAPNQNGNYNTAASWNPSGVPGTGDNIVISDNVPPDPAANYITTITLDSGNEQFNNLVFDHWDDSNPRSLTFAAIDPNDRDTLTINVFDASEWGIQTELIIEDGITLIVNGTANVERNQVTVNSGGEIIFNSAVTLEGNSSILQVNSGGTVTINATLTGSSNPNTINVDGTLIVDDVTGDMGITVGSTGTMTINNDLTLNSNSTLTINSGGSVSVGGDATFAGASSGTVDGSFTITGDIDVGWGITIDGDGTITAGTYSNGGTIFGAQPASSIPAGTSLQDAFYSTASGDYDDASTWSRFGCDGTAGASVPGSTDNVIICDGHSVLLKGAETVNNLTINTGGFLDGNGKQLTIDGSFVVDGTFNSGNKNLIFSGGAGTSISGIGILSLKHSATYFDLIINGNTNFASGTNLFIYGSIQIASGITVTSYGTVETTFNVNGAAGTAAWINSTNSNLRVSGSLMTTGTLTAEASGNTVEYLMDGDVSLTPLTNQYHHLVISGTGIKSQTNVLTINGDFTVKSGQFNPNGNALTIKGDWDMVSASSFIEGSETVTFNGTTDQSITNSTKETFNNLTVNKTSGTITLNSAVDITGTFTFTEGKINTGTDTLSLGTTSSEGTLDSPNSATIVGAFKRYIDKTNPAATQYLFPIGTLDYYRPAYIVFDDLAGTGTHVGLSAQFIESPPGGLASPPVTDLSTSTAIYNTFYDGYWTLKGSEGLSTTSYDLTLVGTGFEAFPPGTGIRIFPRNAANPNWYSNGDHQNSSTLTAYRNNMSTNFPADYCFADPTPCTPPTLGAIGGNTTVCIDDPEVYTVTSSESDNTYTWTVTPAEAAASIGTPSVSGTTCTVTITWANTGYEATIDVTARGGCTSDPATLDIISHPIAPSTISGLKSVPANATDEAYSVLDLGYSYDSYDWTVNGGLNDPNPKTGQTTNSITVDWGAAGAGTLGITVTKTVCGTTPVVEATIDKYIVIESTGGTAAVPFDWNDASSWDCNCIPTSTDNVRILSTHYIEVDANNLDCKNLVVNGGGTLFSDSWDLDVYGDLVVNGDILMTGQILYLKGAGVNISGAGTISGDIESSGGAKTILPTALIEQTGNFTIATATISVTNQGHYDITGNLDGVGDISWINSDYSHLSVSGTIFTTGGDIEASSIENTVEYSGAGQTVFIPNLDDYYHLDFSGTGTSTLASSLDIAGNVSISNSASLDASTFDMTIAGNWTNTSSGSFIENLRNVTFDGAADQTITNATGETFYDLTVNKSGGNLILAGDVAIVNTLTMTQGDIDTDTGSDNLTLGTNTPSEGTLTHTSGTIYATTGKFIRWLTSTGDKLFPIGTSSTYYPVTLTIGTITGSGSITSSYNTGDYGATGLPINDETTNVTNQFNDGYWTFVNDASLSITNYGIALTGTDFSNYSIYSSTRALIGSGGSWISVGTPLTVPGTHSNASGSTCYRTNVNDYNLANNTVVFGLGHTDCAVIATPTITGDINVCTDDVLPYSVPDNGNTYTWTITDGAQTLGGFTNSIEVTWGSDYSLDAKVEVVESSGCFSTTPAVLNVDIHSLPTASITGPASVPENLTSGTYSLSEIRSGYTYTWSVPVGNGTPDPTTGTSINVDWGAAGAATLRVIGQYGSCAAAAAEDLPVTVYTSNYTLKSGNWNDPTVWFDNVVPDVLNSNLSAKIVSPHSIELNMTPTIDNLIIEDGATLTNTGAAQDLTVRNGYYNFGTHITNGDFILAGTSSINIDGNDPNEDGAPTLTLGGGTLKITQSVSNIINANGLAITGNIEISDNVSLQNNDSITVDGSITGLGTSSNFTNSSNATLNISGDLMVTGTLDASATGNTVNYTGSSPQTIKQGASSFYYHLICSGSSTKTLESAIEVNGDLTISNTDVLDVSASNFNLKVAGLWNNTSGAADPFVERSGLVTLDGSGDQIITNTNGESFNNFYVIKSGGGVTLSAGTNITIKGLGSFQKGILDANGNLVIFPDDVCSTDGGDADSFVDGQVQKTGSGDFTFPTGDDTRWARVGILGLSGSETFTAQYFNSASPNNESINPALTKVSLSEYWDLSRSGTESAKVKLHWEDSTTSGIGAVDYNANIVLGHWNTTPDPDEWELIAIDMGASSFGVAGYIVTQDPMTSFSPITVASSGSGNPLPVTLTEFTGYSYNNYINVLWETATETNNDYFELWHSTDNNNYQLLKTTVGQGNKATPTKYNFMHLNPNVGINYYLLKQFDFNGKSTVFDPISIEASKSLNNINSNNLSVYPNPYHSGALSLVLNSLTTEELKLLNIYDYKGQLIFTKQINSSKSETINIIPEKLSYLNQGIYVVSIQLKSQLLHCKLIVN